MTGGAGLRVLATGPQALVQDAGRPGHAGIGVPHSGAADRGAYALANRLLGNEPGAATLEVLLGGLRLRAEGGGAWVIVTGASGPVQVGGRPVGSHRLAWLGDGQELIVGAPEVGLRSYVGVRGGLEVDPVLGSRSTDLLSGLGPAPLAEGGLLPVGRATSALPAVDLPLAGLRSEPMILRMVRGPRDDRLTDPDALVRTAWTVTERSNRVGVRLAAGGTPPAGLAPAFDGELPSEGLWRGAVQVPPGREPVLFLADHPVTGGYPVAGVVVDADVDRAAQIRPGETLRLRWSR